MSQFIYSDFKCWIIVVYKLSVGYKRLTEKCSLEQKMSQTPEFDQYISLIEWPKQSPDLSPFVRLIEEIIFLFAKHCSFPGI